MLAVGGEFFNRNDYRYAGRNHYEEAIWLFRGSVKFPPTYYSQKVCSKAYQDAGTYIMKNDNEYLIIRCGKVGTRGKGTHTHNDNLSFELCANGVAYIVDPGTYSYSGNPEMRNMFRSTAYHNTLFINQTEQNFFDEKDLFLLHPNSKSKVILWKTGYYEDYFTGEIHFTSRNNAPQLIHRREIVFNKNKKYWKINDIVHGQGEHQLVFNFHLNPGINVEFNKKDIFLCYDKKKTLMMELDKSKNYNILITDGYYSPSYDNKKDSKILKLTINALLPNSFKFYLTPKIFF
jgi:uncharacterized heparinase superfamily protein